MWKITRPDAFAVLYDELAKKSLARYFAVMQNEKTAKFMVAKLLPTEFDNNASLETLWKEHKKSTKEFCKIEQEISSGKEILELSMPTESYFDLKIEIANRILQYCHFCTRRCGVNRLAGELGYCKCGDSITVSSIFSHLGEEPELVPSGTIFTMGCTIRCSHCQNWAISQWMEPGTECKPTDIAREVEDLRLNGCRNVNLVGGEPTPWLQQWLETFKHVSVNVPVVWNSNSYYSPETAHLLAGFADVYLLDFKYGPKDCAERISDAPDYWKVCTRNHLEAKKYGELITRVLVLPNHLECCTKPTLNWIAENLGSETRVNLMFQYRPEWHAPKIPEMRRGLTKHEKENAVQLAEKAGLRNFIT
ncbi:MAG: radical SAM protein [Candidatus Bathyarchaeota archaeon]|nr:radical SAM protein [Candidatus Bathyarchaeota archaeon]